MHGFTDYTMARRAVLVDLQAGAVTRADVCDAQPELRRVALHQGVPSGTWCPVCEEAETVVVAFAFGERLARRNGRTIDQRDIPEYLQIEGVRCYTVEVCVCCAWNHIVRAFVGGIEADATPDVAACEEPEAPGVRARAVHSEPPRAE